MILLLSGDIHLNPGPPVQINFAHLNICSASSVTAQLNKPVALAEFISDHDIEILSLSETWLSSDALPSTLNALTPPNFSIVHQPRLTGKGGGVAFIYRSFLKTSRITLPTFTSFEALCIQVSISSSTFKLITIYRPPSSGTSIFMQEFTSLIESLISSPSEFVITGDFNFHVDDPASPPAASFLSILDHFGLSQYVTFPTHRAGPTLDLLVARTSSEMIRTVECSMPFISDHHAILSAVSIPRKTRAPRVSKTIRSIKSINILNFCNDILSSEIFKVPVTTLHSYLETFTSTLSSLLDKHAPLKNISCSSKTQKPFITPDIRSEKAKRSKLETIYRRSRRPSDFQSFKKQSIIVHKLISDSRRSYYRSLILARKDYPRKLWSTLNSLLSRNIPSCLPSFSCASTLAASFLKIFDDKISLLCSKLPPPAIPPTDQAPITPPPLLSSFAPSTEEEEVRRVIMSSSDSSCDLDVIPTSLLKSCLDVLIKPITIIVNLSLSEGSFPTTFKHALVKPLLKKHNLPQDELSSFRPISNLNFISKVLERIIHARISSHLESFPSITPFQSAYRQFHSTETALLRYPQRDLLLAINKQKVSALVLLDLSAAFDTIDHKILLSRLSSFYGLSNTALNLIASYLLDRTQSVSIQSHSTPPSNILTGIPQGSVLGPLLFSLYTSPISQIFTKASISYHLYADDTQIYISFSPSQSYDSLSLLSSTLDEVYAWLTSNRLSVNPSKTEFLIIGNLQQRNKIQSSSIVFCGSIISPSTSAQNLGVTFDSSLSLTKHISSICKSAYYQIRQLRQIRSSLDISSAIILANSLVISKLGYCNSLLNGLPKSSINRLQVVQNSLARAIYPSAKRSDHVSPLLHKLHWLPVSSRIEFKIATLTFKVLKFQQPAYMFDMIVPYIPPRSLRSSNKNLLIVPDIRSEMGRRSFSFAAPTIWNSLLQHIRSSDSLSVFRGLLKTFLYQKSLPP